MESEYEICKTYFGSSKQNGFQQESMGGVTKVTMGGRQYRRGDNIGVATIYRSGDNI